MLWYRQAVSEWKGDRLPFPAEWAIRILVNPPLKLGYGYVATFYRKSLVYDQTPRWLFDESQRFSRRYEHVYLTFAFNFYEKNISFYFMDGRTF